MNLKFNDVPSLIGYLNLSGRYIEKNLIHQGTYMLLKNMDAIYFNRKSNGWKIYNYVAFMKKNEIWSYEILEYLETIINRKYSTSIITDFTKVKDKFLMILDFNSLNSVFLIRRDCNEPYMLQYASPLENQKYLPLNKKGLYLWLWNLLKNNNNFYFNGEKVYSILSDDKGSNSIIFCTIASDKHINHIYKNTEDISSIDYLNDEIIILGKNI